MFRELENSCNKEQTKIIEKAMEWRKSSIVKNLLSKNIEADGNKYSYKNWGDIQSITGF